jgi:hypothetical protein
VVKELVASAGEIRAAVERIPKEWKAKGFCRTEEVALICPRKWLKDSSLGETEKLCGYELADYDEQVIGKIPYIGTLDTAVRTRPVRRSLGEGGRRAATNQFLE